MMMGFSLRRYLLKRKNRAKTQPVAKKSSEDPSGSSPAQKRAAKNTWKWYASFHAPMRAEDGIVRT
jgi:hypothetical protein